MLHSQNSMRTRHNTLLLVAALFVTSNTCTRDQSPRQTKEAAKVYFDSHPSVPRFKYWSARGSEVKLTWYGDYSEEDIRAVANCLAEEQRKQRWSRLLLMFRREEVLNELGSGVWARGNEDEYKRLSIESGVTQTVAPPKR